MINLKQSCAVIAALLTLVACAGVCAAAPAEPPQREIKVVARRFEFVPKTITAKKGERAAYRLPIDSHREPDQPGPRSGYLR